MGKRRWNMGYRFNMLTKRAYAEAGLPKTYWDVRERNGNKLKETDND